MAVVWWLINDTITNEWNTGLVLPAGCALLPQIYDQRL